MNSSMRVVCLALVLTLGAVGVAWAEEAAKEAGNPVVVMTTSKGVIEIELWPDKAPISVANFLGYVDDGFYDGTVFHRVIKGFMIQGGGMDADMKKKQTKAPIKNEANNGESNAIDTRYGGHAFQ